jgi:purine-nucleoside phosphorylase
MMRRVSTPPGLLLAAFPPELAGLEAAPPAGWTVALAGVGAVAAAAGTARLLARGTYGRVLFLGTCGAYDGRRAPGELVAASEVRATSIAEVESRAYRPHLEVTRWTPGWTLPLPGAVVAVTPAITRGENAARELAAVAEVENLELSGVFAACAGAGVPCAAALAVANRCGPSAQAEWRANHAQVSRALVARLRADGVL